MKSASVLALILGGGAGTRLYPLTKLRAKPAVPIACKYRLVDIPISNCLHSGIEQIYLLTEYNSASLHRHITQTYKFDHFSRGWVQILAAEQTPRSHDWYQGTADAVRKQLTEIRAINPRDVLILSGDHLYRMDYAPFLRAHRQTERPIYTHPRFLPPSQVDRDCILDHVLLADGCRIVHSQICESVVGIRSLIGPDTRLTRTIMMGADEYETDAERADNAARDMPDIGVGRGCIIEGAIIDKNARIGDDVVIQHIPNREDVESESYVSRDGIVVVLKNAIIPKGTVI